MFWLKKSDVSCVLNMDSGMAVGWRNLGRDPSDFIVERRSISEDVMLWLKKSDGSCVLDMDSDMAVEWRNLGRDPSDFIVERR